LDKIAVISDIHGNIPALSSVLKDISLRNVDRIFCLGDLVGKGPESKEAIDIVRSSCDFVLKGNWDELITREDVNDVVRWHQNQLSQEDIEYLRSLPFSIDFYMSGRRLRLFHASPFSVWIRVQPWDSIEKRLSMFENSVETGLGTKEPDVVGYGDVHNAFIQHLSGKTLFNAGSVGNPLDLPEASYCILEGTFNSEKRAPFSIQHIRVPYDIDLAIQLARKKEMPELKEYIQELTTSRYRGLEKA